MIILSKCQVTVTTLESDFTLFEKLITELNDLIFSTKTLHYENLAKKLNNPLFQTRTYWSILKTFYNYKKNPANSTSFGS